MYIMLEYTTLQGARIVFDGCKSYADTTQPKILAVRRIKNRYGHHKKGANDTFSHIRYLHTLTGSTFNDSSRDKEDSGTIGHQKSLINCFSQLGEGSTKYFNKLLKSSGLPLQLDTAQLDI